MCDVVFAFGETDGSYYLECPSRRIVNGLPAGVVESLQDGDVSSTVDVAFAPGGGYVIAYNPPCGRGPTLEAIGLDPTLKTWLFEKKADGDIARTFADVKISLGPKAGSYWATDGHGWIWGGLPEKLGEKVASIRNNTGGFAATPKIVTLGLGDDYIMMTETGSTVEISWSLTNYPETEANIKVILEMKRLGDLKAIALNPFKRDSFALLIDDILVVEGLPDKCQPVLEKLAADIKTDAAAAQRKRQAVAKSTADAAMRAMKQQAWDMEYNNPYSLVRYICKHCVRERGLCDCDVADYQIENKFM